MKKILVLLLAAVMLIFGGCGYKDYMIEPKNAEEKLFRSIRDGNFEGVKEAVEDGANINKFTNPLLNERTGKNKKTDNPLLISLTLGRFQIAEYLIDSGADVNACDEAGQSVLQYCAEFHPQIIEKVIKAGADIEYKDKEGNTAIDYSVMNSFDMIDKRSFEILIDNGAKPTENTIDILIDDLDADEYKMLKISLEHDSEYRLHGEIRNAFMGYEVESTKKNKDMILGGIAAFGSWENLEKFIKDEDARYIGQLLKKAVMYENMDVIKGIVENCEFDKKYDFLYYAVENQNEDIIKYICSNFETDVKKAAQHAVQYKNTKAIEYFLNNDLDPNTTVEGESLVYTCCFANNKEILDLLIKRGAKPDGKALAVACEFGYYNIAEALLKAGADPNCKVVYSDDSEEIPVLFETIESGQLACVKLLVENGADTKYEFDGKNALQYSEMFVSERIQEYLKNL